MRTRFMRSLIALLFLSLAASILKADAFEPVPPEDLALKSVAFAPGAPAVLLQYTYTQDDNTGEYSVFERMKILTEEGKKYGEIEIPYVKGIGSVSNISARTVRADGTVVPFNGKIYDKLLFKTRRDRVVAKAFAMPDVQPGNIIEYRYTVWEKRPLSSPSFFTVQREVPVMRMSLELEPNRQLSSYFSYRGLPGDARPVRDGRRYMLQLTNIPAFEAEEFTPPENQLKPYVKFFYTVGELKDVEKFWAQEGKDWAEYVEQFIGDRSGIRKAAEAIALGAPTPEAKLRRLYDRVQQIRNLSYIEEKSAQEARREKLRDNRHVEDVLKNGYGYQSEINRLFVALARGAGFTAEVVRVAERDDLFFNRQIADSQQLNGEILVVEVGGQPRYLDPGTPTAPFGILSWEYTGVPGMRLNAKTGGTWVETPSQDALQARTQRVADLRLEDDVVKGTVTFTYEGQSALIKRLIGYEDPEAERRKTFEDALKTSFPNGSTVTLTDVTGLSNNNEPLVVTATVEIPDTTSQVGSRLMASLSVFELERKNPFAAEQRRHPIYFHYPYQIEDSVKLRIPEGMTVETLPAPAVTDAKSFVVSHEFTKGDATVTLTRKLSVNGITFGVEAFPGLKKFYGMMINSDGEKVVLRKAGA